MKSDHWNGWKGERPPAMETGRHRLCPDRGCVHVQLNPRLMIMGSIFCTFNIETRDKFWSVCKNLAPVIKLEWFAVGWESEKGHKNWIYIIWNRHEDAFYWERVKFPSLLWEVTMACIRVIFPYIVNSPNMKPLCRSDILGQDDHQRWSRTTVSRRPIWGAYFGSQTLHSRDPRFRVY